MPGLWPFVGLAPFAPFPRGPITYLVSGQGAPERVWPSTQQSGNHPLATILSSQSSFCQSQAWFGPRGRVLAGSVEWQTGRKQGTVVQGGGSSVPQVVPESPPPPLPVTAGV